jgi:inorganic pyrophosphatase
MAKRSSFLFLIILVSTLTGTPGCSNRQTRNFNSIPSFSRDYVNVVVEIPAGTSQRIRYSEDDRRFYIDESAGAGGIIDFLPCPGNFGFVPGTFMDPVMGGNGEPLKILVIAESLPTGTVMEVIPLLVLYFNDYSTGHRLVVPIIISIPASHRHQVIGAFDYEELFENYPGLVDILIEWFAVFNGVTPDDLRAMGDGEVAINEVKKWEIRRL